MLLGGSDHTIDKKGRMFIPSRFKKVLGEQVVICACPFGSKCLWGFSEEGFDEFYEKISSNDYDLVEEMTHFISDTAAFTDIDASGRVLLNSDLRKFANIDTNAHLVGMKYYFEIWNPEDWAQKREKIDNTDFAPVVKDIKFRFGNKTNG